MKLINIPVLTELPELVQYIIYKRIFTYVLKDIKNKNHKLFKDNTNDVIYIFLTPDERNLFL